MDDIGISGRSLTAAPDRIRGIDTRRQEKPHVSLWKRGNARCFLRVGSYVNTRQIHWFTEVVDCVVLITSNVGTRPLECPARVPAPNLYRCLARSGFGSPSGDKSVRFRHVRVIKPTASDLARAAGGLRDLAKDSPDFMLGDHERTEASYGGDAVLPDLPINP